MVRTSPDFGRTVDHLYSFNLDRFRPLDHWSGPLGAMDMDSADPASITLQELYKSTQDQLVLTIEKSLDSGKKDLAGRLDDVLLRQRFWAEDIHLEDGALSDLEANDALASSIIHRYLDEIRHLLNGISKAMSRSSEYVPIIPYGHGPTQFH